MDFDEVKKWFWKYIKVWLYKYLWQYVSLTNLEWRMKVSRSSCRCRWSWSCLSPVCPAAGWGAACPSLAAVCCWTAALCCSLSNGPELCQDIAGHRHLDQDQHCNTTPTPGLKRNFCKYHGTFWILEYCVSW